MCNYTNLRMNKIQASDFYKQFAQRDKFCANYSNRMITEWQYKQQNVRK